MLKKSAWLLHLIGDKAPPAARDRSEVARAKNQRCHPHTRSDGHGWCLSSSLSLLVGFSIQDVARSSPQGGYYHADVPPSTGNKEGSKFLMVLRVKPTPTRFPTNSLYTAMDNTYLHSISSVCHPWGSRCCPAYLGTVIQ